MIEPVFTFLPCRTLEVTGKSRLQFPEGGPAWLVVFGAWCALFASLGIMNTMGAFEEYISTHQLKDYDVSSVGWIFSLYAFLTFGVGLFVGPLFDKYGARWLILSGSLLVVLTEYGCHWFWHFIFVFSVLGGVGSALVFSPSITVIGHYFSRRRGIATGIATIGGAVGGIIFPLILQLLIPRIGFVWATKIITLISMVLCAFSNIFIKGRITLGRTSSARRDLRILAHPTFALTVLGVFLLEFALFVPLTYINPYCISKGFAPSFYSLVLPVLNVGSLFGRLLPGYLADKYGRFNAAIVAIILTVISVLGVWLPFGETKAGIVIFALMFGLGSGSKISLTPVCIGQLCNVENYGRCYSTCFSIVSLGCLSGVPIAGKILDVSGGGNFNGLVIFVGCCHAGGLLAFGLTGGKKKWNVYISYGVVL
ncbi:major facilitator superfamily domain-containing protein [Leptodontidium sp. MPI-SDFR-AT-0119]|nr:major facilitator superfamily domain-containing protein [Leptodontidium sp. MPI-SDFR-AT-0119]